MLKKNTPTRQHFLLETMIGAIFLVVRSLVDRQKIYKLKKHTS